jgi:hypothetical protein
MTTTNTRRRWLFYGLGSFLVLLLAAGVGLFAVRHYWWSRQQAQQRAAALAVEKLGGETQHVLSSFSPVALYFEPDDAPNVFFLSSKGLTDDDLKIFETAPVTRSLILFDNRITDAGLVHLKDLTELESLDLRRNRITDAGLVHLQGLRNLKHLYLIRTQVTPAGVAKLQKQLPNTKIAY